jgi:hypothetical protein
MVDGGSRDMTAITGSRESSRHDSHYAGEEGIKEAQGSRLSFLQKKNFYYCYTR